MKKRRTKSSNTLWGRLFQEAGHHCAFCPETVIESLQLHHIDEDPSNNNFENLILACASCHTKITAGVILEADVRIKKRQLAKSGANPSGAFDLGDISPPFPPDPNDPIDYGIFDLKPEDM